MHETDTNPLTFGCACSPFGCDGPFDIDDDVDEGANPMEGQGLPDEDNIQEIDNMIDLPYDTLINTFNNLDQDEHFQNGFGVNMVSHGRYFGPVVHTARRNKAFHASNMWMGPTPAFHGLPYSYAHWRRGRQHHFAEVFISTSIVAHELQYQSPTQYVEA